MRFGGRVAIVTGGCSGIGAATVARLHAEGATVVVADVREEAIAETLAALGGERLIGHRADMLHPPEIEGMIEATLAATGRLDILVNNAGMGSFGRVTDIDLAHWRQVQAIDVEAVFWASRLAIPHLERTGGTIVSVASASGMAADFGFAAYNAAKAALINLTRAMAIDHGRQVRVNCVSPGLTRTPLALGLTDNPAVMQAYGDALILGRPAEPAEVAAAIAFLASDEASYINGHNLVVDGGMTAHTGQPNFTRILGGASHLAAAPTAIRRQSGSADE